MPAMQGCDDTLTAHFAMAFGANQIALKIISAIHHEPAPIRIDHPAPGTTLKPFKQVA